MATIEEEAQKRYRLMKQLNPWMAIDYLEGQLAERDQRIAELEHSLDLRTQYFEYQRSMEKLFVEPV